MTLFITENCRTCARIRDSLDETAVAHETVVVPVRGRSEQLPEGTDPPVLVDDGHVIQGSGGIFTYVEELRHLKNDWMKYQSDTYYCE
ncbi:MAG: glutathione S-transferase N-terminal domain-containing protein [Planctomycetes bacterium]|jgi:glutathione S-transferase|nr:glutathione S-transferase N-terminal domain-containing protein [Planctomycetota bacterium]